MRPASWLTVLTMALLLGLAACSGEAPTAVDGAAAPVEMSDAGNGRLELPDTLRPSQDRSEDRRTRNFRAVLNGDELEVTTHARGQAWFQRSLDGSILYFRLIVSNIEDVTMARVYLAVDGADDPVVTWLYPDGPPPVTWEGRVNGVLAWGRIESSELLGPLAGMSLDDFARAMADGDTYVRVSTESHPDGEIQGWISPRGSGPH